MLYRLDSNALPSASEMSYVDEDDKPQSIHINVSDPTLLLIPACAATFGFASGLLSGAKKSSLQFLAENAHRQPTTLQGWYFYNKTKNYRVALGGAKTGLFTAAKLGAWTSGFVALKEGASRIGLGRTESGAISGTLLAMFASVVCELKSSHLLRFAVYLCLRCIRRQIAKANTAKAPPSWTWYWSIDRRSTRAARAGTKKEGATRPSRLVQTKDKIVHNPKQRATKHNKADVLFGPLCSMAQCHAWQDSTFSFSSEALQQSLATWDATWRSNTPRKPSSLQHQDWSASIFPPHTSCLPLGARTLKTIELALLRELRSALANDAAL